MKYVRGFLMAWGMFCWIPCPYRHWQAEERDAQIGMLPLLGGCIGAAVCLIWWLLGLIATPALLSAAILAGCYFLMTGFIHLDGFMDCSDAVMPQHPEMGERQRILKDSHTGAFGAICLTLMLMVSLASWDAIVESAEAEYFAAQYSSGVETLVLYAVVIMIFTLSRTVSAVSVLICRPLHTSQYSAAWGKPAKGAVFAAVATGALFTALAMWAAFASLDQAGMMAVLVSATVTVIIAVFTGIFDRSRLGGMNGDISGHMITLSEMCGLLALALMA